ncbi:MAG TPA: DNA-binding protein [Pseudonocardia sp.]|nr:DNA-binding protein [Pseudonocardia sp.]
MAETLLAAQGQAGAPAPTLADIRTWPATVDVATACSAFGISRSYGYELAGRGEFPARVIKRGRVTRVVTASIIAGLEASA